MDFDERVIPGISANFLFKEAPAKYKFVRRFIQKITKRTKEIFSQSRFYYFRKHYGFFSAAIVEAFARFSKWHAAIFIITLLGAFLRFYRLEESLVFHGELGHNYLAIKNFIQGREIPLLGPPTSHPWLNFGPLFYWIFAPFLVLGKYNPLVGAYFFAFVGTLVVLVNYFVIEKIFEKRIALLSSFLIASSPAWLQLTRQARFFSLVALFFYPFLYFLIKSLKEKGKYFFWVGLFLGLMLNFHLTPVVLIPAVLILIYLKRQSLKKRDFSNGLVGFLIPNIPFLLYNATHRFEMLAKFIVWVPYRVLGFAGLYPKNTVNISVLKLNLNSLFSFFGGSYLANFYILSLLLSLVVIAFVVLETRKVIKRGTKNLTWLTLVSFFIFAYLGIFIHGDPPEHYYLPIYPLPILFFSIFLERLWKKSKILVLVALTMISLLNFKHFFSIKWFFFPQKRVVEGHVVPYNLQLKVASVIVQDVQGVPFKLSRVGPFDYFEGDYAQNYQYLLWWLGNEPVGKASLRYTIYEDTPRLSKGKEKQIFWVSNMAILKEEL